MKIDLNYYKIVVQTQNDPEILKTELQDLILEVENHEKPTKKREYNEKSIQKTSKKDI